MKTIGLKPNEVTYTVLIKGYCQDGLIEEGLKTLASMKLEANEPNIRTYNTILRGCMRYGNITEARLMINEMRDSNIEPDITSHEYYIKLLCQYLQVKEAWEIANDLQQKGIYQASIFSAIATAAALKAKFKLAAKAKRLALECLELNVTNTQGFYKNNNRASVNLFMGMRNEEIESECKRVEEYITSNLFNNNKKNIQLILL